MLEGLRPHVPSRASLPGPDTATFAGLDAYIQLMRWADLEWWLVLQQLLTWRVSTSSSTVGLTTLGALLVSHTLLEPPSFSVTHPSAPPPRAVCRDCWAENPRSRPNFAVVVARLQQMMAPTSSLGSSETGSGPGRS